MTEEFLRRKQANPSYSYRAMARDLGLHSSRLSEVVNGKKGISRAAAKSVAEKLGLNSDETDFFCDLADAEHARNKLERKAAAARLKKRNSKHTLYVKLDLERFKIISHWYHNALLELSRLNEFKDNPHWIAKRLGIDDREVVASQKRLMKLGLAIMEKGRFKAMEINNFTPSDVPSYCIRMFHESIIKKALLALFEQPVEKREFSSTIFSIDKEQLPELKKAIRTFWRDINSVIEKSTKKDSLYCLSTQFFCLLKEQTI